jgi:hypothetical protein
MLQVSPVMPGLQVHDQVRVFLLTELTLHQPCSKVHLRAGEVVGEFPRRAGGRVGGRGG